eukprot:TRINITY_DN7782_c0_g1_i1.p1 TRINITY_DN7782_c0_g1~~TRINITY_DN7782_c0_g1_i1.p1  ORF type:complete len:2353 (-),score=629.77 TRINITY_DN7782_c0_g1_i1:22-7080(-)
MADGEDGDSQTELVTLDVEKPLFVHGPRLPACCGDDGSGSLVQLCYNASYDLVFIAKESAVLAYEGRELVEKHVNGAKDSGMTSEAKCCIKCREPPLIISTSEEGAGLLCIVYANGHLSIYDVEAAKDGKPREVFSTTFDGEEIVDIQWKHDDLICVCDGGRTFFVQPQDGAVNCVHDVVDFKPSCAAACARSDVALLGGPPAESEENYANLWAVDVTSTESWPLFIEGVPQDMEEQLGYASLRGMKMLPPVGGGEAGGEQDVACLYVLEEENEDPTTLQAIVSVSADYRRATLKALGVNELFMSDYVDHLALHSVWVPEWKMVIMGMSACADFVIMSSHSSALKSAGLACSWAVLAPPEGKQLSCPNSQAQDAATVCRGLCLLTSFKGSVDRKGGGSADVAKLAEPPVVLVAASDGSLSIHYCDHSLPPPKEVAKAPAKVKAKTASSTGVAATPATSPFAGLGGSTSTVSPFGAGAGGTSAPSPFGAGNPSASPFGAGAGGTSTTSPFGAGNPSASPFGASSTSGGSLFGSGTGGSSLFGGGAALASSPFAAASAAGSTGTEGAAPAKASSPFAAASAASSTGAEGAAPAKAASPAAPTSGGGASLFSAGTSTVPTFGAAASSGSLFGGGSASSGASASSLFGSAASSGGASSGSLFGGAGSSSSLFGAGLMSSLANSSDAPSGLFSSAASGGGLSGLFGSPAQAPREESKNIGSPAPSFGGEESTIPSALPPLTTSKAGDFEAASTFAGARDGFAFKSGPQGLGYYADNPPPSAKEWSREKVTKVYTEHNPSKLSEIEKLLEKYSGKEIELYEKVCKKYNVTPEKYSLTEAADAPSTAGSSKPETGMLPASSGGGLFGGTASSGGGLFGAAASSGGGLLSSTASTDGGLFGSAASSGGGLFGGASSSGGGLFGAAASSGGGLSSTTASTGGGLFGAAASSGGGLLGSTASTGGGLFGSSASAVSDASLPKSEDTKFKKEWCREQITKVYTEHNPSKLSEIEGLMAKYAAKEFLLYEKICKKYNVTAEKYPGPSSGSSSAGPVGSSASSGGGLLGSSASSGSSLFGSAASSGGGVLGSAASSGGGLFGAAPAAGESTGSSLFGSSASTGGGLFGSTSTGGLLSGASEKGTASAEAKKTTGQFKGVPLDTAAVKGVGAKRLSAKQDTTKVLLSELSAGKTQGKALEELLPSCQALEKELTAVEEEDVITPSLVDGWSSVTKDCKAAEEDCAAAAAKLKVMMDGLDRPKIYAELSELQSETLRQCNSFITEKDVSSDKYAADMPRLGAIRGRCAQVEAQLSAMEKDLIERFGDKVDAESLGDLLGVLDNGKEAIALSPLVQSALANVPGCTGQRVHFPPSNYAQPRHCGQRWPHAGTRPPNPLRAPRNDGRKVQLGELALDQKVGRVKHQEPRAELQEVKDGDRGWFLQQEAQLAQQRAQQLNERALDIAERAQALREAAAERRFDSSSLGQGAAALGAAAAAACQAPVRKLRASLYEQLRGIGKQQRRRVKRSDHLALDRGALDLCGERPQSEIDTPTFGTRGAAFGSSLGAGTASNGEGLGAAATASGDDERLLMPPPLAVPKKGAGSTGGSASSGSSASASLFGSGGFVGIKSDGATGGDVLSSLFGSAPSASSSLSGGSAASSGSTSLGSLFGSTPSSSSSSSAASSSGSAEAGTSGALGSLFGSSSSSASGGGGSLFGTSAGSSSSSSGGGSLFGASAASSSSSSGGLFGAAAPAAAAAATVDVKQAYKDRMIKIYQQHNPSKVGEIDTLMGKYVGQEHTMYLKICKKYNVPPEPEIKPGATASIAGGSASSGSASSGGGLFGSASPGSASSGGGLFGAAATSGGGLFGSSGGASSSSLGGSLFGGSASSSGGLGGASSSSSFFGSSSSGGAGLFGTPAASAPAAGGGVDVKQAYKDRMVKIYQQHNPSKVGEIDTLMGKYVGQEHTMYLKICKKYNVPPEPEIKAGGAPSSGGGLFGSAPSGVAMGGGFGMQSSGGFGGMQSSGSSSPFGGAAQGGLFGGGASSSGFGGASSSGFGASSSGGGLFGGAASSGGFGGGGFGAPATAGAFGAPASSSPFGAPAGGSFGAPASGGGLFGGGGMPAASPFGASTAAPAGGSEALVNEVRQKVTQIYQQFNPTKLGEVESLLAKYRGKEQELYLKVCKKYNVNPPPPLTSAAPQAAGGGAFGAPAQGGLFGGQQPSAFGAPQGQQASPFGGGMSSSGFGAAASPFGGMSSSGFGGGAASPFGGACCGGATQPAFGNTSALGSAPGAASPFGAAPASPFGGGMAAGGGFGALAQQQPSGFGGSPFGGGAAASPFGGGATASPFGGGACASPFGGGNQWTQHRG